jgi:hypothetical protein
LLEVRNTDAKDAKGPRKTQKDLMDSFASFAALLRSLRPAFQSFACQDAGMKKTLAVCLAALLAGCASTSSNPDIERLSALMAGSFSSEAQSKAQAGYFHITLKVARIWPERADGPWLYVEQATATAPQRPYRQRVYRLSQASEGGAPVWVSATYTLPGDALRFAGAWDNTAMLKDLQPSDLSLRTGCDVFLKADGASFAGSTRGKGCASDLRGASYATSEVRIDASGMTSWDRGLDSSGQQVWGATAGGYRFDRMTR